MEQDLEKEWTKVELFTQDRFGEQLDEQSILFIIGLQELGINKQNFKKEEKLDVIHIGLCTVLSTRGYYKMIGKDDDGWPHFKNIKKLPNNIYGESQVVLVKKAIIDYLKL